MIELRPFTEADFGDLLGWVQTPELMMQWAGSGFTFPLTTEQLEEYVQISRDPNTNRVAYTVWDTESEQRVGHIGYGNFDPRNKSATVSRVLVGDVGQRGRGIGQQMMNQLLKIGFEDMDLHRIDLVVFDFNASAIALYEKVGFQKEGLFRECRRFKEDEYWSLYQMSLLRREWEKRL